MVVGIVSEPGEDSSEFVIVTPDDTEIKTGEFVYYESDVEVRNDDGEIEEQRRRSLPALLDGSSSGGSLISLWLTQEFHRML
jgi:hypothetical protein